MKIYGTIEKAEEQDDGTIKVYGYASTESVDSDGETVTADAMKAALPDYLKWGAVREMHDKKAAGTAIEADVQDDGRTWFGAHVVDSEAVKKVKAGVYKGFSIGGKVKGRDSVNKSVITSIDLIEVSLVDRPANPEAVFTMYKAEVVADEPLKKSMWNVSHFAELLSGLACVAGCAEAEKQWDEGSETLPSALRDWIAQGVDIFGSMAAEEGAKLIAELREYAGELPDVEDIEMAQQTDDLNKAGAKFSKATQKQLAELQAMLKMCDEHLSKMEYNGESMDDGESEKAQHVEDLQKYFDSKLAEATDALKSENESLRKRVAELEALPQPPKAVLHVVEKSQSGTKADEFVVKNDKGGIDEVASMIKSVQCGRI